MAIEAPIIEPSPEEVNPSRQPDRAMQPPVRALGTANEDGLR